jgi:ankyrin repeat protein
MLIGVLFSLALAEPADTARQDAYLDAVRKGDAAAVKTLLDQGVPVDAKFRYDRTALSFAADRGNVEVVKVLLDRGADVEASDTFYHATPLVWAFQRENVEVARLLLDKGAKGGEQALDSGVEKGNAAMVSLAIEKAKPTADELSIALAVAEKGGKAEIVEQLKKAGATPLPPANQKVAPELLAAYAGTYKTPGGFELKLEVKDGVLVCLTCGPPAQKLGAVDDVTFRPEGDATPTVVFRSEGGKVRGLTLRRGRQETPCNRVEDAK